jgi:hypothetical protein
MTRKTPTGHLHVEMQRTPPLFARQEKSGTDHAKSHKSHAMGCTMIALLRRRRLCLEQGVNHCTSLLKQSGALVGACRGVLAACIAWKVCYRGALLLVWSLHLWCWLRCGALRMQVGCFSFRVPVWHCWHSRAVYCCRQRTTVPLFFCDGLWWSLLQQSYTACLAKHEQADDLPLAWCLGLMIGLVLELCSAARPACKPWGQLPVI